MASSATLATTKSLDSESFRKALTSFRSRLEGRELILFQQTSLEDLKTSLYEVQERQDAQKDLIGISRLKGYLEATEQLGKIVEVFLNVNDAVAFVWGPVKFVLQTASTWSHAFDQLLDAYKTLGDQFPLILQYESLFGKDQKMQDVLVLLYCDILEFHRRALPFFRKRVWKQVFRSMWNDFSNRFAEIISSVQRHARMLEAQAHLIHFQNDNSTRALLLHLENEQRTVLQKFEEAERDRKLTNMLAVRQWIGGITTESTHDDACQRWKHYLGTGEWILKEKQISGWMNDDIPQYSMFWLHGMPGAGKTVLTSIIIENCKTVSNAKVVYFYCRFDDEQRNKYLSILKGFLAQIITLYDDLAPYFLEKSRDSREAVLTDVKIAKDLLEPACYFGERLYIVLDGLDECSRADRRLTLNCFTSLTKKIDAHEPGRLRILVSSQSETDIVRALPSAAFFKLLPQHNKHDISQFVSAETQIIKQKFDLSDEQTDFIRRQVNHCAAGQFIYARLVLDNLLSQATVERLVNEIHLSRFPKQLSEAYQRILERIRDYSDDSQWHFVEKMLGWMVCAARPMSWSEMQTALSIDYEKGCVDFYNKSLRFDIKDACGSLVSVDDHGKTTLIHSTAKTFFIESGRVVAELIELELSALCLHYLTLSCFEANITSTEFIQHIRSGQFAFQDYAIAKWEQHFRQAILFIDKIWSTIEQPEYELALQIFVEAVNDFVNSYEEDFLPQEKTANQEDGELLATMEKLRHFGGFEGVMTIHDHNKAHRTTSQTAFNDVSLKRLKNIHEKSRTEIERLPQDNGKIANSTHDLTWYYGSNRFKCCKLTCYHFHEGFADAKLRQSHLDRHTRPYQCPVLNCSAVDFGFISKNNLDAHVRAYHPELEDTSKTFPTRKNPEEESWKHSCEKCQKKFSRNAALRDHELVHAGQKPHQCKRCGKAFTRKNDRDRHERTIHAQRARLEKSFR